VIAAIAVICAELMEHSRISLKSRVSEVKLKYMIPSIAYR